MPKILKLPQGEERTESYFTWRRKRTNRSLVQNLGFEETITHRLHRIFNSIKSDDVYYRVQHRFHQIPGDFRIFFSHAQKNRSLFRILCMKGKDE